tara:strand:+ start:21481 stop:21840 length:360 start_codon:yes stop_codon:yes gene_type:complete
MNAIEENLHISTELSLLEQQLYVDFNSLGLVIYNKTDEEILFTSPIDTVRYNVTESIIIRNLDTLNNTQNDMTFYFEGNQVQEGIIDAIKIDFLERDQNIFLYKVNDATTILLKDGTED